MRKVQYISFVNKNMEIETVRFSDFSTPDSLDSFDINVIDFTDPKMWYSKSAVSGGVNCGTDITNIRTMISKSSWTRVLIMLPSNVSYIYKWMNGCYQITSQLKNELETVRRVAGELLLPVGVNLPFLVYENTRTLFDGEEIPASFCFDISDKPILTTSIGSKKYTTCKLNDRMIATTLLFDTVAKVIKFANSLFFPCEQEMPPDWMESIVFGSDKEQQSLIRSCNEIIGQQQLKISIAEAKLKENNRYKSILYSTGDQLVQVVFDILQKILDCDLSGFIDKKREDFVIKKENVTFVGEIKGVNSNVKNENISQVDRHEAEYNDDLQEKGLEENTKQLLIINPLRMQPIGQRETINEKQIKLAIRNGCLIVKTEVLLRIFEAFQNGIIDTQTIEKCFVDNSGELLLKQVLPEE